MDVFTTTTTASEDLADHALTSVARVAAVQMWREMAAEDGWVAVDEPTVHLTPDHRWEISGPVRPR